MPKSNALRTVATPSAKERWVEKGATQPEGGGRGACSSVGSYFHYRIPGLFICWVLDAFYRYNGHCFDFDQPVGVDQLRYLHQGAGRIGL